MEIKKKISELVLGVAAAVRSTSNVLPFEILRVHNAFAVHGACCSAIALTNDSDDMKYL